MALSEQGVSVSIYAPYDAHSEEDIAQWSPLQPQVFPRQAPHSLAIGKGLKDAVMAADHDVLHLHGIWQYNSAITRQWQKQTGRSVMISPRGMLDPWALSHSGWKKKLVGAAFENDNLARSACLHALNKSEASSMRQFGLKQPIAIIPNGTDTIDLSSSSPKPDWAQNDTRKTLLFLGRIHEKKGLDLLIEAWGQLKAEQPAIAETWRIIIAGWDDGGYQEGLQEMISAKGLSQDITFIGSVFGDEKAATLAAADAFILPSYSEGLPMSVLEAWSYQLPVFMTEACNIPEGFSADAAVKIPVQSKGIKDALIQWLPNETLMEKGQRGRALVERDFTWPMIARKHIEVYRAMMGQQSYPAFVET